MNLYESIVDAYEILMAEDWAYNLYLISQIRQQFIASLIY